MKRINLILSFLFLTLGIMLNGYGQKYVPAVLNPANQKIKKNRKGSQQKRLGLFQRQL